MSSALPPEFASRGCPACGKPAAAGVAPFCSRGCRDRDLLQWLGEGHRIPGSTTENEESDEA